MRAFKPLTAVLLAIATAGLVTACVSGTKIGTIEDPLVKNVIRTPATYARLTLQDLPPAAEMIDVAVYGFEDKTGQNKPADGYSDFSRAVTQGGAAILIEALKEAGNGKWFRVVERASLQNLLQERNIIEQMRGQYEGRTRSLPALRFAGMLVEGGIIGYDTNQVTGGQGARFLGIGLNQTYREDSVTVSVRTVSVATGEVLSSVTTTKSVYSYQRQGNVVAVIPEVNGEILELEAGDTINEPVSLAVRQAIEFAVYSMIMDGVRDGIWKFKDPAGGRRIVDDHIGNEIEPTESELQALARKLAERNAAVVPGAPAQ